MPHFSPRRTQPMRPDSYRRIARLLRGVADRIERYADSSDPHHKAAITQLLHTLGRDARQWSDRHRATMDGSLSLSEPRPMAMLPNDYHPGPRCSCRECLRDG